MITWQRSADIRDGKVNEATAWALRLAAYVNENFGNSVSVHANVAGPASQIHWLATYDSLAEFEETFVSIFEDAGYQKLLAEATDQNFYITQTVIDSLYRSLR